MFSEGDRVQFTAPSKALRLANRELGTTQKINDTCDLEIRTDLGREIVFNIRKHPHLDHGYAVTSHSSQGQTADRVLVHVDTEKSELLINNRFAYCLCPAPVMTRRSIRTIAANSRGTSAVTW